MNIHKNARLTPLRREEMAKAMVEGHLSKAHVALTYGVSAKIVAPWVERFKAEGPAGMVDRSSRPRCVWKLESCKAAASRPSASDVVIWP